MELLRLDDKTKWSAVYDIAALKTYDSSMQPEK